MTLEEELLFHRTKTVRDAAKPLALFLGDALVECYGDDYIQVVNRIRNESKKENGRDQARNHSQKPAVRSLLELDLSDLLRLFDQCLYLNDEMSKDESWKREFILLIQIPRSRSVDQGFLKNIKREIAAVRIVRNNDAHKSAAVEVHSKQIQSDLTKFRDLFSQRLWRVLQQRSEIFSERTFEVLKEYVTSLDDALDSIADLSKQTISEHVDITQTRLSDSSPKVSQPSTGQSASHGSTNEQANAAELSSRVASAADTPTQEASGDVADMHEAEVHATIQSESSEIVVEVIDAPASKPASTSNTAHISAPFPSAVQQRVRIPSRRVSSRVIIGLVGVAVLLVVGIMMFSSSSVLTSVPKNCVGIVLLDTIPASKYEYISTLIKNHVGAAERIQVAYVGKNGRNVELEETDTEPSSLLAVVSKLNSPGAMLDRFEYRRRFDAIYEVIQKAISQEQAPTMMIVGSIGDFTAEERGKLQRREVDLYPQKGMSAWWVSNKVAPPTFVYWTPPTRSDSALFVNFPDKSGEMKPVVEILK